MRLSIPYRTIESIFAKIKRLKQIMDARLEGNAACIIG
jgi:hypothetical protein